LIRRILLAAAVAAVLAGPAAAAGEAGLYSSTVIVTGQSEENRLLGFRQCVPQMLVRVSGDQRLLDHAGMDAIVENAAAHVAASPTATGWRASRSMTSRAPMTARTT
jgi:hypothetical protein